MHCEEKSSRGQRSTHHGPRSAIDAWRPATRPVRILSLVGSFVY